jgi:lipopolysaccharide transport system ATP-binding protein
MHKAGYGRFMNNVAIHIENLGKSYRLGAQRTGYQTLRAAMADAVTASCRRFSSLFQRSDEEKADNIIWALRDITCEIQRGEVVGIIGGNGAGKSTLLKILSRITEPTTGFAEIHGRVSSLLEVGTGFHPELTGRENIYLNSAILGMRKAEIERKFDDIVAFAETERFIDTPVKHYSSGMYLRLAFAVAAYLEPDILMVDEVLAVGDASFQKKCLGRMGEVASEGRTVLFVSHNLGAITQLCARAVWIDKGQVRLTGPAEEVVTSYLTSATEGQANGPDKQAIGWTSSKVPAQLVTVQLLTEHDQPTAMTQFSSGFKIQITYRILESIRGMAVICKLTDAFGHAVWTSWDTDTTDWNTRSRNVGQYRSVCTVPGGIIRPGGYSLSVGFVGSQSAYDICENVSAFEVSEVGYVLNADRVGIITPLLQWEVESIQ